MCINSLRYVCCSEYNVVSNECNEPTSYLVQPFGAHCCEVMYFGCFGFRGELGFLNCDDVCMCVVNKQFQLLEFVSESVYVDLEYDEISLTFTAGSVYLCGSGVLSSTCDVLEMSVVRGVGGVCDMCMCLARGGVGGEGGEWMRELGLGFTNPVETGGVLDVCLCFGSSGVGGVGGEWAWTRVGSGGVVLCLCKV